ncbi:MAG: hypothetical protein J6Q53_00680 [Oscillospiraceae bacterium]|nr:hypothetical protein [Oscillospiraceae bacterium]
MKAIIDFFTGLFDIIDSLVDFVISFIQDIVYVIQLTASFVAQIPNYFGWLPSAYLTIIISIFSVVVIYKVLGREG